MSTQRIIIALVACATAGLPGRAIAATFDLKGAIAAAHANDVVHVPAGAYPAPVTVDKPLTLVADGPVTLRGAGNGDVLIITAPDVTVRNFTICHTGDNLESENAGIV